jgi:hypothetical protein
VCKSYENERGKRRDYLSASLLGLVVIFHTITSVKDPFQLSSGFTVGEVGEIKVVRSNVDQPIHLDFSADSDVVASGEDEFVVKDPFGFVIQAA